MLERSSDYLFTTIPSASMIMGRESSDFVPLTHEHWLWANECVRTYEYLASLRPDPYSATYAASKTKDSADRMTASRTVLDDWVARCDAIVNRGYVLYPLVQTGVWRSSKREESVTDVVAPNISQSELDEKMVYYYDRQFDHPDGIAPSSKMFARWCSSDVNTTGIAYRIHDGTAFPNVSVCELLSHSYGVMGNWDYWFQIDGSKWQCNGIDGQRPEASSSLKHRPFFWDGSTFQQTMATAYFREVSDEGTLEFSRELQLGYGIPSVPWTPRGLHSTSSYVEVKPVIAILCSRLWKCTDSSSIYHDMYSLDQKRSWCYFVPNGEPLVFSSERPGTAWLDFNMREYFSGIISEAASSGFNPANIAPTAPQTSGSAEGWTVVGHQVYAYPTAIFGDAHGFPRDMGK